MFQKRLSRFGRSPHRPFGTSMILPTGSRPRRGKALFDALKANGVVGFDLDVTVEPVTDRFVEAAYRNGMYVSVYTITDPPAMRETVSLGVDAVETDFPGVLSEMPP